MVAYEIAILTINVLSALIKSYNQNKINYKTLKEHTELKLSFLKDIRNEINNLDIIEEIDNIIDKTEALLSSTYNGTCISGNDMLN